MTKAKPSPGNWWDELGPKNQGPDWLREVKAAQETEADDWLQRVYPAQKRLEAKNVLSGFPDYSEISGFSQYHQYLKALQQSSKPHPHSDGPPNREAEEKTIDEMNAAYDALALKEYSASTHPYSHDKVDFLDPDQPTIGHKFHLNVAAKDAKVVSDYLINNGYYHKYIDGGEIEDGKTFTVYIGSHALAHKLAAQLSQDLQGKLCRPLDRTEVEYAPNVVGRFMGKKTTNAKNPPPNEFHQYPLGLTGISALAKYFSAIKWGDPAKKPQLMEEVFEESYRVLAQQYGAYFHGPSI